MEDSFSVLSLETGSVKNHKKGNQKQVINDPFMSTAHNNGSNNAQEDDAFQTPIVYKDEDNFLSPTEFHDELNGDGKDQFDYMLGPNSEEIVKNAEKDDNDLLDFFCQKDGISSTTSNGANTNDSGTTSGTNSVNGKVPPKVPARPTSTTADMERRRALLGSGFPQLSPRGGEISTLNAVEQREEQGNSVINDHLQQQQGMHDEQARLCREEFLTFNINEEMILKMQCVTWNMYGKPPPPRNELEKFIPVGVFDIYVIGTEECENSIQKSLIFSSKAKWVASLKEIMGDSYLQVAAETMQAIHLIIFVRKEVCMYINNVETQKVPTGIGDMLGNKGAVAVSMDICKTSFLFINAHFNSGEGNVMKRNGDYHKINSRLTLRSHDFYNKQTSLPPLPPRKPTGQTRLLPALSPDESDNYNRGHTSETSSPYSGTSPKQPGRTSRSHLPLEHQQLYAELLHPDQDAVNRFDVVVWMGDLNYRVQALRKVTDYMIKHNMLTELLNVDELLQQLKSRQVFQGFFETAITFPPTYKFDVNTNRYDSSEKHRVPSWTDRILWKAAVKNILIEQYSSCATVMTSDHRPVFANVLVKVLRGDAEPVVNEGGMCNTNVCQTQ